MQPIGLHGDGDVGGKDVFMPAFSHVKHKWNTNQEIANLLYEVSTNASWVSLQTSRLPESGSQLLFSRYDGCWFKNDGYLWRKRKDGHLIREDHLKLKVNKQELISTNYAHSAVVSTFHRRVYWLTDNPDYVLVHYLNTATTDRGVLKTGEAIAECLKANSLQLSRQQLIDQLAPIYANSLNGDDIGVLATAALETLQMLHSECNQGNDSARQFQLERRNSCSSAFRRGLSSMALRRQPSANSEIDANYIGSVMKSYGCGNERFTLCAYGPSTSVTQGTHPSEAASRSPSGDTDMRSNQDDVSVCNQQSTSMKSSTGGGSSTSVVQDTRTRSNVIVVNNSHQISLHQPTYAPTQKSTPQQLTPIVDISASTCSTKGGKKILVVGAWYMKGHDYSIVFNQKNCVPAKLIQAGVLSAVVPPAASPGTVTLTVLCNGSCVSMDAEFTYTSEEPKNVLTQSLVDRLHFLMCAFGQMDYFFEQSACVFNEEAFVDVVRHLDASLTANPNVSMRVRHPSLLCGSAQFPTQTVLHIAAALNYAILVENLLALNRHIPRYRELNPLARDVDGATPLHVAVRTASVDVATILVSYCRESVDVLDDRGRTPCDLSKDEQMVRLTARNDGDRIPNHDDASSHLNATKLWVMTNGETVTREHLLHTAQSSCNNSQSLLVRNATSSCSMVSEGLTEDATDVNGFSKSPDDEFGDVVEHHQLHVEISMDTNVHVPDSPQMAKLFHAVTSPGVVVTENARANLANLARQIIEALPERIKQADGFSLCDDESFSTGTSATFSLSSSHNPMFPQPHVHQTGHDLYDMMLETNSMRPNECGGVERVAVSISNALFSSQDDDSFPSTSTRANTFDSESVDFDKDLGEFFAVHLDAAIDPIQQQLGNLKLSDNEQREVYEAAMVIQRAYREYRARNTSRRQADAERNAAVTIQCCYRRYKQFCYFKKLHNAAIVVQKHFRMRKRDDKEEDGCGKANVPEHPTLDGQSIRIQVPQNNSTLLRQHRAATTIQLAYRGHRKRQAAARKIQKFMKQSRNNDAKNIGIGFSGLVEEPHFTVAENACAKRRRYVCDEPQKRVRSAGSSTWFYFAPDVGANAKLAIEQFGSAEWDQLNKSIVFVSPNTMT